MATRKSTIGALRPSGNHAKVYSGSSVVLPSLDIEGGSPAIWLEIDGSVRKRVLETHGPKTSHPQVSQNSRTRQKTGVERCRQKVEKAVGARGSTHGNIDSLVNKHLASFRNAEKTFAGAKALVQTYREKYPQLADYIPEGAVEHGIHIRENATDESTRRRHSCAGGRPWVLKRGSRLSGRSGVIPLEIRFIESDRREGVPRSAAPRMGL